MKISQLAFVLLIGTILLSGCTSCEVCGIYENSCEDFGVYEYLKLESDGTFGHYVNCIKAYGGDWRLDVSTLVLSSMVTDRLTLEGDTLIDELGCVWVKQRAVD